MGRCIGTRIVRSARQRCTSGRRKSQVEHRRLDWKQVRFSFLDLKFCRLICIRYFSSAVATAENRALFAGNILLAYLQYGVDGIEIDWEYPGQPGAPGNEFSPEDTANFLLFLKTLRDTLPPEARITAAVESSPFLDKNGKPLHDMQEFSKVLDWVLIMNYDLWGCKSILIYI